MFDFSHDVAAPLTPTHQEVAGYINYSAQFVPHLEWRLVCALPSFLSLPLPSFLSPPPPHTFERMIFLFQEVIGIPDNGPIFHEKGKLKLKLIHEHSKQALAVSNTLIQIALQLCL